MHTSSSAAPVLPAALLDGLLETAGDAVFRVAPDGAIHAAGTRAQRLGGFEPGCSLVTHR